MIQLKPITAAVSMLAAAFGATAADIVLTPPATGGVAITNAAGNTTRMRVGEDGIITMPGLGAVPGPATGLCHESASGNVGTCALAGGTVTNVSASAPLNSSGGATPNIGFPTVPVGQVLAGTGGAPAFTGSPLISGNIGFGFNSSATSGGIVKGLEPFLHNVGVTNTFVGLSAGNFTMTGGLNTGGGSDALKANTTGSSNTALGAGALSNNTIGAANTAIGDAALALNVGGNNNTAVGYRALFNTSGAGNIAIGHQAGFSQTTGSNNIAIGHSGSMAGETNTIHIGFGQTRAHIAGIYGVTPDTAATQVFVDSAGQLGIAVSSRRAKDDIFDMGEASDALLRLRPVAFVYTQHKAAGHPVPQYGLIAEEVAEVAPELVMRGTDGQVLTVKYHLLAPMLVNEVQKQRRHIEALERKAARVESMEAELASIKRRLGLD